MYFGVIQKGRKFTGELNQRKTGLFEIEIVFLQVPLAGLNMRKKLETSRIEMSACYHLQIYVFS